MSVVETYCQSHFANYKQEGDVISGILEGESEYMKFMENLTLFGYLFAVRHSRTTNSVVHIKRQHLEDHSYSKKDGLHIKLDHDSGLFYFPGKNAYLVCSLGKDYVQKYTPKPKIQDDSPSKTKRKPKPYVRRTKKIGCPAVMQIKQRYVFTEHCHISESVNYYSQNKEIAKIQERIDSGDHLALVKKYYVRLTMKHNHIIST